MIPAFATGYALITAVMNGAAVVAPAAATLTATATAPVSIPVAAATAASYVALEAIRSGRPYVDCDANAEQCIRMCHQFRDEGTGGCVLGCRVAHIVCKVMNGRDR
jgi:hypothetical protein